MFAVRRYDLLSAFEFIQARKSIADLTKLYAKETQLTFSETIHREHIRNVIHDEDSTMFIAYMDGSIIGYCIISRYREHVKQYFGIVNILYVSPSYRGTEAGRGLIKAATEWFDTNDCSMSYANSTSIIGRDKIFENMTKKFGYESFGSVMMRKKTK